MSALAIQNLRKTYPNGFVALKGINLQVERGEFFGLLGPNGAGKSTLIGILSSLVNKTGGRVSVFGQDLDQAPEAGKSSLGLVPQEFNCNLFQPVLEVVMNQAGYYGIPRQEARRRAEYCLRTLDLWDRRHTETRQLSGGMKRRLLVARALVHQPRLLILDEPTAGVDIEIRRALWQFLQELNEQGTTILLTTHYLEEAESLCRRIALLQKGRIVAQTSVDALITRLPSETFLLNLRDPLQETPRCPGFSCRKRDDRTLEVAITREQTLNQLFSLLSQQGIAVLSLRNKQNRLEQLVLSLLEAS